MKRRKTVCVQMYLDRSKKYRWRIRRANGRIIAVSGESFHSKSNAKRAYRAFESAMQDDHAQFTVRYSEKQDRYYEELPIEEVNR